MTLQRLEFHAMGSRMEALLDVASAEAADALAEVPRWFEAWEQTLSRFRAESELSRLNDRPGEAVRVSPVLWEVIQAALSAERASGGLVTPALLNELEAAGYEQSFDLATASRPPLPLRRRGSGAVRSSVEAVDRNPRTRAVTLPAGVRLDLGGIAKGWAADQAVRGLQEYGPALVNAGGDIAVSGPRADGEPWPIGVTNPFSADEPLETLRVMRGGVATSGRDYHRWTQAGIARHHLLDPRTGQPAETDLLTATVLAPTARQAEMAAKVALILGSTAGLRWLDSRPPFAGLLVLETGRRLYSRRMSQFANGYLERKTSS